MSETVRDKDLIGAMRWIRDLRAWAYHNHIDPWAVRQALIMALEADTDAALRRGISKADLDRFDSLAKTEIKQLIHERWKG